VTALRRDRQEPHGLEALAADAATVAGEPPTGSQRAASAAIRGLFGRDSIYLLLWAVQVGTAALITPICTRILGPSSYGLVASSIAVMQVLLVLGALSLQTAVQRQFAEPRGERDARRLITLSIVTSALVFVVADATGPLWAPALGFGGYPHAVRFAIAWASLGAITQVALGLLRSYERLIAFAAVSLLQSVVAAALGLLLVLLVQRSSAEYVLGQVLAQAAAVAVALYCTRPLAIRRRHLQMARRALGYALPLVPGALATFVLDAADRLVLQHSLGSEAVARYAVAYNLGSIPILLLGALSTMWMPRVFALAESGLRNSVLAQSRNALYALLIPVVAGLSLGAPLLLRIWAPPSYRPDDLLLVLATVAASSFAVAGATTNIRVLLAEGRTAPIALATIFAAAVNLALNFALVPIWKLEGSALATLLAYVAFHASLVPVARRVHPFPRTQLLLAVEAAIAVAIAIGSTWLPVSRPALVIRLLVALACLGVFASVLATLAGVGRRLQARWVARWLKSTVLVSSP
jgi:O-antigen/teichoic acid export membrane protein